MRQLNSKLRIIAILLIVSSLFLLIPRLSDIPDPETPQNQNAKEILSSRNNDSESKELSPIGSKLEVHHHEEKEIPLFTFVDSNNTHLLRELVGSVHSLRHDSFDVHNIVVFGYELSKKQANEIKIWRNVDFYDLSVIFPSSNRFSSKAPSSEVIKIAFDFLLRKYRVAIYVRLGLVFRRDCLHDMEKSISHHGLYFLKDKEGISEWENYPVIGFSFDHTEIMKHFITHPLQCLRDYQCDSSFERKLNEFQINLISTLNIRTVGPDFTVSSGDQVFFCRLLLRDDVLYSFSSRKPSVESSKKPIVALGMPTLTVESLESPTDVAMLRIFLPSMLKTITPVEWQKYVFRLYIGYDEEDRFFDNEIYRNQILLEIQKLLQGKPISIEFVKFPFTKGWVTFLWNGLFVKSITEGADYFYQLNDDVELLDSGWLTAFIEKLQSFDNVGVVGPHDVLHSRMLLTQAFVHRKHHYIFGRLYPHDIKDWYSDDWISQIYQTRTYEFKEYRIRNHNNQGTRYTNCADVNLQHFLNVGREAIAGFESKKFVIV